MVLGRGCVVNKQAAMIRELRKRGIDPSEPIAKKDWDRARIRVHTPLELAQAGARRTKARFEHSAGIRQVPQAQTISNLNKCRENLCGSYGVLKNGDEVCWRCTCRGGKDLIAKASNREEHCPHEPPLWDNRTKLTVEGNDAQPN